MVAKGVDESSIGLPCITVYPGVLEALVAILAPPVVDPAGQILRCLEVEQRDEHVLLEVLRVHRFACNVSETSDGTMQLRAPLVTSHVRYDNTP